jgi:hypothetical protein
LKLITNNSPSLNRGSQKTIYKYDIQDFLPTYQAARPLDPLIISFKQGKVIFHHLAQEKNVYYNKTTKTT